MSFTLAAAGDIILSSGLKKRSSDVLAKVGGADLSTANLEVVITDSRSAADKFICLGLPPGHVDDVTALGFKVLSVANNHALDFGVDGLRDTLASIREAGIVPVGGGENLAESLRPALVNIAGARVAVIAATTTLPNSSAAGTTSPGVAPVRVINRYRIDGVTMDESPGMSPYVETEAVASDVERLCAEIRDRAGEADIVVVHMHWGVPMGWVAPVQDEIADYQRPLAHALIDAGANLIVGHHPHVVQGVEFHRNAPIFYSLGNFIKHGFEAAGGREGVHPPYKMTSLRGYWNRIGCLALVDWDSPDQRPKVAFMVTRLDEAGEPGLADETTAAFLRDRLIDQCEAWGTSVTIRSGEDGGVYLDFDLIPPVSSEVNGRTRQAKPEIAAGGESGPHDETRFRVSGTEEKKMK